MNLKIGDLAYIPSETYLFQYRGSKPAVDAQKFERLKEPKSLLVIGEVLDYYEILMFGDSWFVKKREVYPAKGRRDYDNPARRSL